MIRAVAALELFDFVYLHSANPAERLFLPGFAASVIDSRALRGPAPPAAFHRSQGTPAAVLSPTGMSPARPAIPRLAPSALRAIRHPDAD